MFAFILDIVQMMAMISFIAIVVFMCVYSIMPDRALKSLHDVCMEMYHQYMYQDSNTNKR